MSDEKKRFANQTLLSIDSPRSRGRQLRNSPAGPPEAEAEAEALAAVDSTAETPPLVAGRSMRRWIVCRGRRCQSFVAPPRRLPPPGDDRMIDRRYAGELSEEVERVVNKFRSRIQPLFLLKDKRGRQTTRGASTPSLRNFIHPPSPTPAFLFPRSLGLKVQRIFNRRGLNQGRLMLLRNPWLNPRL